jgi:uncharacterized protein (TIGR00725 family)
MAAPVVAVIGKGLDCPVRVQEWAEEAGRAVGRIGAVLVTGGLGGAMAAAARGAGMESGIVVGLCPAGRDRDIYDDPGVIVLRTGLPVPYRNALTGSVADAAIVVPGSHGTVQEGMVLAERGVPLIGYGWHDGWPSQVLEPEWAASTDSLAELTVALIEHVQEASVSI